MSNNKDFKVKNGVKPTVYHEAVGTVVSAVEGYALASASYDSVSFSVGSQDLVPYGLTFNNDGTSMYVLGGVNNTVFQYTLSTAYDVSTASYASKSFSLSSQSGSAVGVAFNDTGTKMYISTTTPIVHQYDLSTAFDVITSVYNSVSLTVLGNPFDIIFNGDGSKLYVTDVNGSNVYQYSLSTAYDLSTGSYDNVSLSVVSRSNSENYGIAFNGSGTALFVSSGTNDTVDRYNLTTAYDLSTASYGNITFSVASQDTVPYKAKFSGNGTKMYMLGRVNASVFQYSTALNTAELDLSTGSVFEVTPTSDIQVTLSNPADSGTVSGATLLLDGAATSTYSFSDLSDDSKSYAFTPAPNAILFKPDGSKMFTMSNGAIAYQHTVTNPNDITTASYDSVSFNFGSQDAGMFGLFFKSDGTKMYAVGSVTDTVYQYSLSTAWDLSTASYDSVSLSVAGQDSIPVRLFFKPDGTKMYIDGANGKRIFQYSLSTAWDLSTASYDSVSYTYNTTLSSELGQFLFTSDGTQIYFISGAVPSSAANEEVIGVATLSTAWDITTIGARSTFNISSFDAIPYGIQFSVGGVKLFVSGDTNNKIYQLNSSAAPIITYDPAIQWSAGTAPTSPAIGDTDVITFSTRDGGTTYNAALAIDGAA